MSDGDKKKTARREAQQGDRRTPTATIPGAAPGSVPDTGRRGDVASATDADVADFVAKLRDLPKAAAGHRGRLIFAMDATMSREPTWDLALGLQGDMFRAVKEIGGLDVQLVYYRGAGECRSSKWVSDTDHLARLMRSVSCVGGYTQVGRVLSHIAAERDAGQVSAAVIVGDAFEEDIDTVCGKAGEVAIAGVPVFMFQEGRDATAERAFREIARLTKGAWCRFDHGSADQLRALLTAVATYASGGRAALERLADARGGGGACALIAQMK